MDDMMLARKGSICLIKYNGKLYGVERQTKATAYGMMYTEDKQSAINYFNKEIKAVRATRKDFNLEIYAHS